MNLLMPLSPIVTCFLAFVGSVFLSIIAIPKIIYVAETKHLFDIPDSRKHHPDKVSSLGGSAIYFGFMIVSALFINTTTFPQWNYYVAASLLILIVGLKDDLIAVAPLKKFAFQFAASFIMVCLANIKLQSFYGFLGMQEVNPILSYIFCTIGVMFVTNAFNLIDGIDGLAGTNGFMSLIFMGFVLFLEGNFGAAVLSFSLAGAIAGFLRFNISPAKIFMGDTGSLIIGFSTAVLAILCVNSYRPHPILEIIVHSQKSMLLVVLSVLFIPVFDAFRVFLTRILHKKSPFAADRTHVHHYLLDAGLSHNQAVFTLAIANVILISIAILLQNQPLTLSFSVLIMSGTLLFYALHTIRNSQLALRKSNSPKSIPLGSFERDKQSRK